MMHNNEQVTCGFCKLSKDDELKYGKLYTYEGLTAHYFCILLSPNLCQTGNDNEGILGFMPSAIQKELRRANRLKCYICNKNGASLGCCFGRCKRTFHLPCGIKNKCINQYFGLYESFCDKHAPTQVNYWESTANLNVQKYNDLNICGICCEGIKSTPDYDTIWTVCCHNGWFHRNCIMNLANNTGYHFFKCPLCNNKKQFTYEMQRIGIYIPDQDASWEREPRAFEDLYYKYSRCDSDICSCPWGRQFLKKYGPWTIVICETCGSSGSHNRCRAIKGKFHCTLCYNALKKP